MNYEPSVLKQLIEPQRLPSLHTVLVLGGYGNFGTIISRALARDEGLRLLVAGHNAAKARCLALSLSLKEQQGAVFDADMLFPQRYHGVKTVTSHVSMGAPLTHLAIWACSWPVRWRLIRNMAKFARPLLCLSRWLQVFGQQVGNQMELNGADYAGEPLMRIWPSLPERYLLLCRYGMVLGVIAFSTMVAVYGLMIFKPGTAAFAVLFS